MPEHVSLVCTDSHQDFRWCKPTVAHIQWDERLLVRRILRWVNNVALGKDNHCKTLTKTQFIDGGSIGPASS